MSRLRLAYMPLITYPDSPPEESVEAAVALAITVGHELHATTFAVEVSRASNPVGGLLINIPEMIRVAEDDSRNQCRHLQSLVEKKAGARVKARCSTRRSDPNLTGDAAAVEARYFDLVLLPWSTESASVNGLAQAVVFGAGRPSILVPPGDAAAPLRHVAVAWDASRVAARALADLMPLLGDDCRVTVLTVQDEKAVGTGVAESLASSLEARGLRAEARTIALGRRTISEALQVEALEAGAEMLAMGGFGHSRIRDFVLGGATKGVFADLRLPVLLSH